MAYDTGTKVSPSRPVLLVEDNEDDIFFMQRAFKLSGIENALMVAQDGRQALDYLEAKGAFADRTRFPLPCIVLLDLQLPMVKGLDVLKWMRSKHEFQTLLVVIVTSSREARDIDSAYRLGANSFLVKPPDELGLREMVDGIKLYWLTLNQLAPECME
ncbi:MAG TPA: response regulator [Verrucomicrobiae bacterium]|nr:response regulator [Verrucomicrobiae bacterium]